MYIEGQNFYDRPEGLINARIMNKSTATLCDEMITKYSSFCSGFLMGYGDGVLAEYYATKFERLHILEGSDKLCGLASRTLERFENVFVHMSMFEDFVLKPAAKVDVVIGTHVLEHVHDPLSAIIQSKLWLKDEGIAIFTVPNAQSLHRRIGVRLNLLKNEYELNNQDRALGHQRVLDWESFCSLITSSNLRVLEGGGYNLKLVSQLQMIEWTSELHEAIYEVSRECPTEICSNLFVCCMDGVAR